VKLDETNNVIQLMVQCNDYNKKVKKLYPICSFDEVSLIEEWIKKDIEEYRNEFFNASILVKKLKMSFL
jgi:hypothetical protein